MKHAKKLVSLLLALVLVLSLGTAALAAGASDGSITVRNATVGERYSVYKVFDLTYATAGDATNVAYFYTKTGDGDALFAALTDDGSPFTLTATPVTGKYNAAAKDGKTAADISSWLKQNEALLTRTGAEVTATGDTVVFSGLAYGYYYVKSSLGAAVTLDSTLKDVKVVDKNQGPSWDNEDPATPDVPAPGKVIVNADGTKTTVNAAGYGDTVRFSIAVNATAYAKNSAGETKLVTYYHITDTLAAGFDAAQNIKVTVNGTDVTAKAAIAQEGNRFDVTLPFGEAYGANAKIEVTYTAQVNNAAALAGSGNRNTANFTYTTDNANDPTNPPYDSKDPTDPNYPEKPQTPSTPYQEENQRTTTTYVYALGLAKVDPQGKALRGAEFTVTLDGAAISAVKTADGVYERCAAGAQGAVTQFTVGDGGVLLLKGLADGAYTVTEVNAPAGYNLLTSPVTIQAEIEKTATYTETITIYKDADGNVVSSAVTGGSQTETTVAAKVVPLVVVNQAGTELPSTGGMGTTLFYVLGGVLVAAAAVLLFLKKRAGHAAQ